MKVCISDEGEACGRRHDELYISFPTAYQPLASQSVSPQHTLNVILESNLYHSSLTFSVTLGGLYHVENLGREDKSMMTKQSAKELDINLAEMHRRSGGDSERHAESVVEALRATDVESPLDQQ
jgi:hypothetical protein